MAIKSQSLFRLFFFGKLAITNCLLSSRLQIDLGTELMQVPRGQEIGNAASLLVVNIKGAAAPGLTDRVPDYNFWHFGFELNSQFSCLDHGSWNIPCLYYNLYHPFPIN